MVISIASLLFLAFALGACHSGVSKADLVIANSVEPESLDPVIISGQAETRIVECLFEGLVRIAPQTGAPEPGLAHRWDVSNGGRTYVFHLRDNLVWSDGRPLKALDVEKSWMRSLSPKLAAKYVGLMFCIKGAKLFHESAQTAHDYARSEPSFQALDELRFRVELEKPTPYFLQLLTMPIFSVAPIHVIEENPTRWILESNVPVNGPYKLKWWKLNQSVRLVKNETYWDSENTSLDTVDLLPISNPSTALNLYLTGQVDIIWDKDLIPTQIVDEISKRMDYHQFDYLGTYFIRFNATHPPLDQPKIRRALSLSIDRQRITEKITRAGENPTSVLVPPGVHNYNPDHSYSLFDPEQAALLPKKLVIPPTSFRELERETGSASASLPQMPLPLPLLAVGLFGLDPKKEAMLWLRTGNFILASMGVAQSLSWYATRPIFFVTGWYLHNFSNTSVHEDSSAKSLSTSESLPSQRGAVASVSKSGSRLCMGFILPKDFLVIMV